MAEETAVLLATAELLATAVLLATTAAEVFSEVLAAAVAELLDRATLSAVELTLLASEAKAEMGARPGKKLAGRVGMGILAVVPKSVVRSSAMVAAEYPVGAAVTVVVVV